MNDNTEAPLLRVSNLTVTFPKHYGKIPILRDITFDLRAGETLGVVGESGSGKSILGLTILGLEPPSAKVTGKIAFRGRDIRKISRRQKRGLRGREIAMIYQDALVSLNPGMKIRTQLAQSLGARASRTPADLLKLVRLEETERFLSAYPHQLSGGQRQRVLIAMALARTPSVIVADEPTTALDVTVQAEILELLAHLRRELMFALILISHDLGLVAGVADRIAVLYAGDLEEMGDVGTVLRVPEHPYTAGLLEASRSLEEGRTRLAQIPGAVPGPAGFSAACRFNDRCPRAQDICRIERPQLRSTISPPTSFLCHFPLNQPAESHVHNKPVSAGMP